MNSDAQTNESIRFDLDDRSTILIEGTSSVSRFTCASNNVQGYAVLKNTRASQSGPQVEAEIAAPVKLFSCNLASMNLDFWTALKSDQYPLIEYWVDDIQVDSTALGTDQRYSVFAVGRLAIAGVKKTVRISLSGEQIGRDIYRLRGSQEMKMTDFQITPPSMLFGLIKAHDNIVVRFNLVTTTKPLIVNVARKR